jgi:hypothetical protein
MSGGWEPSQAYLDYTTAMKKYGRLEPDPPTPFDPCDRFRRLPDSCAICAHTMDALPCPDLREVFLDVFPAMKGGDLSTPDANDGSPERGPGGRTDVQD